MKTATKPNHTPTPWYIANDNGIRYIVDDAKAGIVVCTSMSEADAAFIIKTVNVHKELVHTIKDLISELKFVSREDQYPGMDSVIKSAENVIAKAENQS